MCWVYNGSPDIPCSALAKSELGPFISEYYRDHILTPCMNKLAQPLLVERDNALISKMVEVWVQFYTSILPTLLAIFVAVQVRGGWGCGCGMLLQHYQPASSEQAVHSFTDTRQFQGLCSAQDKASRLGDMLTCMSHTCTCILHVAAVQRHVDPLPPQIQQMLLVLQSVHHSPPGDNFFVLQDLVCVVVESYWPMVIRSQFKPGECPAHGPMVYLPTHVM